MASLGIIECLSKTSNAGVGSRPLAKELEVVSIESDGFRELLDSLDKVSLFSWSLLHVSARATETVKGKIIS